MFSQLLSIVKKQGYALLFKNYISHHFQLSVWQFGEEMGKTFFLLVPTHPQTNMYFSCLYLLYLKQKITIDAHKTASWKRIAILYHVVWFFISVTVQWVLSSPIPKLTVSTMTLKSVNSLNNILPNYYISQANNPALQMTDVKFSRIRH